MNTYRVMDPHPSIRSVDSQRRIRPLDHCPQKREGRRSGPACWLTAPEALWAAERSGRGGPGRAGAQGGGGGGRGGRGGLVRRGRGGRGGARGGQARNARRRKGWGGRGRLVALKPL